MKTAYINGSIHTMNDREIVEAMLVENDTILKIGSTKEILEANQHDEIKDMQNKTIIPGFNDSHLHALLSSQKMQQIDVSSARSIVDLIRITKEQLPKDIDEDTWIIGRGWNQDYFTEKRFPTKDDLDQITTKNPLILIRTCIHICTVNTKALNLINLDKNNLPVIDDGEIYIDKNGEPNGLFSESALNYVYDFLPEVKLDDIKKLVLNLQKNLNSYGITSIQSDDFTALNKVNYSRVIQAYKELAKEEKLTIKINQQCLFPDINDYKDFLNKGFRTKQDFGYYRIGPLKILLDGSLGARTAYMENNYYDEPTENGISVFNDEQLYAYGKLAQEHDMQMAIHGIGDGTINQILRMYKKANDDYPKEDHRHGIVHCQITNMMALDNIAAANVVVYAQPIFLNSDIHIVDSRVGKDLGKTSYAFKTLIDKGVSVSFSTDSPVDPFNPFNNIYCAVTRNDLDNSLAHGWNEQECVSVYEAVHAYTVEGAYQSFEENTKGLLIPNYKADFIVLSDDIFSVDPLEIPQIKVLETFIDGRQVYSI